MKHLVPFGIAVIASLLMLAAIMRVDPAPVEAKTYSAAAVEAASLEGDGTVLLKFGAPWCPPCRRMDVELDRLEQVGMPVRIRNINVDEEPGLASAFAVGSIPRTFLIQDGRILGDEVGFQSSQQLQSWIEDAADASPVSEPSPASEPSPVQGNPFLGSEASPSGSTEG
ncbi:MAG: thioredoxin family protein [Planctomycetota bacterium]